MHMHLSKQTIILWGCFEVLHVEVESLYFGNSVMLWTSVCIVGGTYNYLELN